MHRGNFSYKQAGKQNLFLYIKYRARSRGNKQSVRYTITKTIETTIIVSFLV